MNPVEIRLQEGSFNITHTRFGTSANMHQLTAEQFDALTTAFDLTGEIATLTTETGRTFRTADIDFGGLRLTTFADA